MSYHISLSDRELMYNRVLTLFSDLTSRFAFLFILFYPLLLHSWQINVVLFNKHLSSPSHIACTKSCAFISKLFQSVTSNRRHNAYCKRHVAVVCLYVCLSLTGIFFTNSPLPPLKYWYTYTVLCTDVKLDLYIKPNSAAVGHHESLPYRRHKTSMQTA